MRCALDTGRHRRQVVQNRNECAANLGGQFADDGALRPEYSPDSTTARP